MTMQASPKPFDSYPGGKDAAGVAEKIIGDFPPHGVYVELFLGGGAVLRRKTPALRTIGVEIDPEVCSRWRRVKFAGLEIYNANALTWLEMFGQELPADALVYADPPYPMETRSGRRLYRFEFTRSDHVRLLKLLKGLPCSIAVSSYDNPLYREALEGWNVRAFQAMTRGGVRLEHVWSRSTIAGIGVDGRKVGRDFRERERIKRKCSRWRGKFERMPPLERTVVLQQLLDVMAR